jgi:Rad3-related DNA helicase
MNKEVTNSKTIDSSKAYNSRSILFSIKELIRVLSHKPDDGKFILKEEGNQQITLQYLCLNATTTLKRMLDQVKALIFISGTLEPS